MSVAVHLVDTQTSDGVSLHGAFLAGAPVPRASGFDAALFMHGVANTFYGSLPPIFAETLSANGIATLRANNRGHDIVNRGNARLPFLGAAFERIGDCVHDWNAWLDWLGVRGYRKILLCGHSLGAVKTAHAMTHAAHPLVAGVALLSPPRFSYERWIVSARAGEFQEHLDRAQALVAQGRPDELMPVTMPVPFLASAASYLAKYGPDAHFDVFENLPKVDVPTIAFTGALELDQVEFGGHPAAYAQVAERKLDLVHHLVPGADHFYRGAESWVLDRLAEWMPLVAPLA
jgi:Alpha/beta hydrolase family